jgi:hypothetical protein
MIRRRTDLQKEIDHQQIYGEAAKVWDAQQKAMMDFEKNILFGLALKGLASKIPFVSQSQTAYEFMRPLFEMRQQQQQLEKEDQGGQGSPTRVPKLEWNSRYGNKAPLPTQAAPAPVLPPPAPLRRFVPRSSAGDWLGLQQSDFGAKLPQGIMGGGAIWPRTAGIN